MPDRQPVELLFLSQEEGIDAGLVDMDRCVETMAYVFDLYDRGRVLMGNPNEHMHGHVTTFPGNLENAAAFESGPDRRFSAMPAYVGGDVDRMGIKWYGSNVANPSERGLPRSIHTMILNDPTSGQPLFLMDGQVSSAMRTGAMAGLGAASIQGDRATTAAILGPGVIGQTAALGLDAALDELDAIRIHHPTERKAAAFEAEMRDDVDADVTPEPSLEAAVRGADVTVVATTADPPPAIDGSWLPEDSLVVPLGDLRIPLDAFDPDRIFCDVRQNALEFAEQVDWEITNRLGAAVNDGSGPDIGRSNLRALHELVGGADVASTEGRSIFYSPGLPMEDVAWTNEVYENATAQGLGRTLTMFDEPYFTKPY
jgi:ornithine cyclodeaminase